MAAGLKGIRKITEFEFERKNVFLRLDLNVPIENGKITDDNRIRQSLPTIQYIREKGGKIVMCSHLGRPKSADDKSASLLPVAERLSELLKCEVILVEEPGGDGVRGLLKTLAKDQILLLENIRYESGETKDEAELASHLAVGIDIYINDAFGASHRAHASIHALPKIMKEKGIGFLIEKEIEMLTELLNPKQRPYIVILGGAKVSDKIGMVENLIDKVDGFIVGGAMANTFMKAQNYPTGKSRIEDDKVKYTAELIGRIAARKKKFLLLPTDFVVAPSIDSTETKVVAANAVPADLAAFDIGPQTAEIFAKAISTAGTIFWNGPMGVFEKTQFAKGTSIVAHAMAENAGIKVVGGGDSAAAAAEFGVADKMTHVSTGGGASLEYLQGTPLPGLEVLRSGVKTSENTSAPK